MFMTESRNTTTDSSKKVDTTYVYRHLDALIERARQMGPIRVAIAYPCDTTTIEAASQALQAGLIIPILVGPLARIQKVAEAAKIDLNGMEIVDTLDDSRLAADTSAALCRDHKAQALMKGSLHSDELLGAAVSREAGLRGNRRASHCFVIDVPSLERPLMLTDCVVNIAPGLMEKRDITQSAIDMAHALGIAKPNVAILSAVETINPAMQSTLDAAVLCKMADRGQITGGILDGPLAFDNAISSESAHKKGIVSPVAGQPDILIMPNLEAGNMLYKQLVYISHAECAGLVLGMRVPIILTSRSDSVMSRIASCALAVLKSRQLIDTK
jgi:phosphate acetyltransferase